MEFNASPTTFDQPLAVRPGCKRISGVVEFSAFPSDKRDLLKVIKSRNDFFQANVSSKKTNKQILLYYYETSDGLVFVRFLEEIEDTKNTF